MTDEILPFEFLDYDFDENLFRATFRYRGGNAKNPLIFEEKIDFSDRAPNSTSRASFSPSKKVLLDRALFLSFVICGTSYYKAFPTHDVIFPYHLDETQADFFNHVYQEGLSQFAYENSLKRADLAHFKPNATLGKIDFSSDESHRLSPGTIALQSGGKDSLLTATLLDESDTPWSALYISTSDSYPAIIDQTGAKRVIIIKRSIDLDNLKTAAINGGKNGHVPVTYINLSFALIQAIIDDQNTILTSIGHEGEESHSIIKSTNDEPDLAVNHQWSKTAKAEKLLQNYVQNYVSPAFKIHSPLRKYSELKIAELFVEKCWHDFGYKFSSCNVANYNQHADNTELKWCGRCAKCANSYLLFAPFLNPAELNSLFPDRQSLFEVPELANDFKGLLGIDQHLKPFECVGEIAELRQAYHLKKTGYPDLPFSVPTSDFDYHKLYS